MRERRPASAPEQGNARSLAQDSNLDLLRASAVLMVLVFHFIGVYREIEFWGRIGHFGVLIFFVHTSFVLLMSLERMVARQNHIVWPFYVQRAFRIYPLSILCVICSLLFHIPVNHYNEYVQPSLLNIIGNLVLMQNITGGGPISGPMWSLSYEVQMYLLLPFIFLLLQRHPRGYVVVALVVAAVLCASAELLTRLARGAQYFPCFMGGIIAFWMRSRQKPLLPAFLFPVWIIFLSFIYTRFPDFLNLNGSVFCMLIGGTLGLFRYPKNKPLVSTAHTVAKYSYGIYLAHMPLLWVFFHKLQFHSQIYAWMAFLVCFSLLVFCLFHLIEDPLIKLGKTLTKTSSNSTTFALSSPCKTLSNELL